MKLAILSVLFVTLFSSFSSATPTASLDSRTFGGNKCKGNQFWYKQRNCCLDNGGPRDPPQPPSGRDCPGSWYWNPGQGCCTPRQQPRDDDPEPQCGKKHWKWKKGSQCCEKDDDDDPPSPPQASPKPNTPGKPSSGGPPGGGGKKDDKDCKDDDKKNGKGKYKRNEQSTEGQKKRDLKSRNVPLCPFGMEACPITSLAIGLQTGSDYECIESDQDVRNCGGCVSTGQGQDCTAIPNALNVACNLGSCAVRSCELGYELQGQSCVKL